MPVTVNFFVGERYEAINFELADKSWSLDNTKNIKELFRLGRTSAAQEVSDSPRFFDLAKKDFVPD